MMEAKLIVLKQRREWCARDAVGFNVSPFIQSLGEVSDDHYNKNTLVNHPPQTSIGGLVDLNILALSSLGEELCDLSIDTNGGYENVSDIVSKG